MPQTEAALEGAVAAVLTHADQETVRVVTALAGLLGAVAYADREYSADEARRVHEELERVEGMTLQGIQAVARLLEEHILELSTVHAPRYCRVLRELADRELREQVLEILVDLAAADGVITTPETNLLRQLTTALGLTQDDYNTAQAKHRERLGVLRE